MVLDWRPIGIVRSDAASVQTVRDCGVSRAIWKLVYHLFSERVVYIGSTDNLARHVKESIYRPAQGKLDEYFRRDLLREAGSAELFIGCDGLNIAEREHFRKAAIDKELESNDILLNKEGGKKPEWLEAFRARSALNTQTQAKYPKFEFQIWDGDYSDSDAIDDLGADVPTRHSVTTNRFARDPRIRERVRQRAAGKCEYCGKLGFSQADGSRYVECHHIIALADAGADLMTNVIALCPEHHREAHFGARRVQLEAEMQAKLREMPRRSTSRSASTT